MRTLIGSISTSPSVIAKSLQSCTRLKKLDLSCNRIGTVMSFSILFKCLMHCKTLEELQLNDNGIHYDSTESLSLCLSNLRILGMAKNDVTTRGVKSLATQLQYCAQLQELNLQGNRIDKAGIDTLIHCLKKFCPNFRILDITDTKSPILEVCHFEIRTHPRFRWLYLYL